MKALISGIAVCAGVLAAPLPAHAGFDGSWLYEGCSSQEVADKVVCGSYISGVIDSQFIYFAERRQDLFCVPGNLQVVDMIADVAAYLERFPGERGKPAAVVVYLALQPRFGCRG